MKTIRDYDLNGKRVLIRVDFNVPIKDGVITDDNRIKESLMTINYAIENNANVISNTMKSSAGGIAGVISSPTKIENVYIAEVCLAYF